MKEVLFSKFSVFFFFVGVLKIKISKEIARIKISTIYDLYINYIFYWEVFINVSFAVEFETITQLRDQIYNPFL